MLVAMTANDRPWYLKEVLESWAKVRGDVQLMIRAEPHSATYDVVRSFDGRLDIRLARNRARLGVKENPRRLLNDALEIDEFVVYTEDDVLVSNDVLEYMTWAKNRYRDELCLLANQRWWKATDEYAVRKSSQFTCLTFGVWRDRAETMLTNFDRDDRGWDWSMAAMIRAEGWRTLAPDHSRSQHIGVVGEHGTAELFPASRASTFVESRQPLWDERGHEVVD